MSERIKVGSAEIAVARDADYRMAAQAFLRDANKQEIPREAFRPYFGDRDPSEPEESGVSCFVIRSQGKNILVDAGVGPWGLWRFGEGHLLDSLAALDLRPEDIDFVLPTHLHLDHVGWNTRPGADGRPVPTFTKARYLFQQRDWDHFMRPEVLNPDPVPEGMAANMSKQLNAAVLPLKDTGLMDLIGSEHAVTDEVTLLHTPGHTPGSVTVVVQSGGQAALLLGDVAHHPVELSETDWSPLIEVDATLSARSRKAVVDEAVRLNAYVAGAHFLASDPTFGQIVQIDNRRFWRGVSL
jgi:glyoxylase-like metal-dependent hydrolase (beta-lactamase superfamily II)